MASQTVHVVNQDATEALAKQLAAGVTAPCTICLDGPLGAGKSVFARAFLRAHGITGDIPSPTFTLVQTYRSDKTQIWHMDAYRLEAPEEALELGLLEAFQTAIVLLEWPGKIAPLLPEARIDVFLQPGETDHERRIEIVTSSDNVSAL